MPPRADEDLAVGESGRSTCQFVQVVLGQHVTLCRIGLEHKSCAAGVAHIQPSFCVHGRVPRALRPQSLLPQYFTGGRFQTPGNSRLVQDVHVFIHQHTGANALGILGIVEPQAVRWSDVVLSATSNSQGRAVVARRGHNQVGADQRCRVSKGAWTPCRPSPRTGLRISASSRRGRCTMISFLRTPFSTTGVLHEPQKSVLFGARESMASYRQTCFPVVLLTATTKGRVVAPQFKMTKSSTMTGLAPLPQTCGASPGSNSHSGFPKRS